MYHPATHVATIPDKAAYVMAASGRVVTYRELHGRLNQSAQLFRAIGLRPGDAIAFCLENHPPAIRPASSTNACSRIATGRAAQRGSCDEGR